MWVGHLTASSVFVQLYRQSVDHGGTVGREDSHGSPLSSMFLPFTANTANKKQIILIKGVRSRLKAGLALVQLLH